MMLDAKARRTSGPYDLVVLEARTVKPRVLVRDVSADTVAQEPVAWSPDGRKLAFAAGGSNGSNIEVINSHGTGLHRLTSTNDAGYPVWSRNGQEIFYARAHESPFAPSGSDIWSMRSDGSGMRQLTSFVESQFDVPTSVSPNGILLAFTRRTPPPAAGLAENVSSVRLLNLKTDVQISFAANSSDAIFTPPNGTSLILASTRNKDGLVEPGGSGPEYRYADLFLAPLHDGPWREVTHTSNASESDPTISQDANRIAFESSLTGRPFHTLFQANVNGSCRTPVGRPNTVYYGPAWRPQTHDTVQRLRCHPDDRT